MRKFISATAAAFAVGIAMTAAAGPAHAELLGAPATNQSRSITATGQADSGDLDLVCGYGTEWILATRYAYYNHCGPTTIVIRVNVPGSGSANDYNLCVRPGKTGLGPVYRAMWAYYIGGAGCRP